MREKTVYAEQVGNISERWIMDGDNVHVQRQSDEQHVVDAVAKANAHGTGEIEGLGRLVAEVPIGVAMMFCQERGIPWEKFMYGNEYDAEFKRFIRENPKLCYNAPTHKVKAH